MSNETKTAATAQELFRVVMINKSTIKRNGVPDPDTESTDLMTQETVEFYRKYNTFWHTIKSVEPVGKLWPEGVEVERTGGGTPFRCYSEAFYDVRSPRELKEEDFDILRAQGCFMSGQETGVLVKTVKVDAGYIYKMRSVCDSSD